MSRLHLTDLILRLFQVADSLSLFLVRFKHLLLQLINVRLVHAIRLITILILRSRLRQQLLLKNLDLIILLFDLFIDRLDFPLVNFFHLVHFLLQLFLLESTCGQLSLHGNSRRFLFGGRLALVFVVRVIVWLISLQGCNLSDQHLVLTLLALELLGELFLLLLLFDERLSKFIQLDLQLLRVLRDLTQS